MAAMRPARVLLVEDYPANQRIALAHLRDAGHRADLAENGQDAVQCALSRSYDLILMDVELPGMDGLAATAAIREAERCAGGQQHVLIVGVTAHGVAGYMDRCLGAGMDLCMHKPLKRNDLLVVVASLLEMLPPSVGDTGEPALDVLRAVEDFGNDREALRRILQGFLEDVGRQIELIRGAVESGDTEIVRRESHRIRGGAANLGADPLARVAAELEESAKQRETAAAAPLLARMERSVAELRAISSEV
jgi:CheY-like chemotaxis protein/HPt (histidine-containing phosphotransfer) domain-containing protein